MLSSAAGALATEPGTRVDILGMRGAGGMETFDELATVDLARCDFEGYHMVLGRRCELVSNLQRNRLGDYLSLIEELYRYTDSASHIRRFVRRFGRKERILVPLIKREQCSDLASPFR